MLSVTKYDITNIPDSKTVYKNCSCTILIYLQNNSGVQNTNIVIGISKFLCNKLLRSQMTVFTMYRNCIFRLHKGVDQLDFLLAGMSGYMCILENNLGTFHRKLVDNLGYSLLITWNRMRAENKCIIRFNGNLLVDISSHTGKSSHGLPVVIRTSCSSG